MQGKSDSGLGALLGDLSPEKFAVSLRADFRFAPLNALLLLGVFVAGLAVHLNRTPFTMDAVLLFLGSALLLAGFLRAVPGLGDGRRPGHGRRVAGLPVAAAERRRAAGDHRRRPRPGAVGPDRLPVGAGRAAALRTLPRAAQERPVPGPAGGRQGRAVRGSADPRDRLQRRDDAHRRHRAGERRCHRVLDGVGRAEGRARGREVRRRP